jgi:hypothetical protein
VTPLPDIHCPIAIVPEVTEETVRVVPVIVPTKTALVVDE